MDRDPSIYCVSAWNDHGQRGRVKDNNALYRTDVMPGLGWYINSKIGLELAPKWPMTNWDDWMRLPGIKNGRSCVYPEVGVCGAVEHALFAAVRVQSAATVRTVAGLPPGSWNALARAGELCLCVGSEHCVRQRPDGRGTPQQTALAAVPLSAVLDPLVVHPPTHPIHACTHAGLAHLHFWPRGHTHG